MFLLFGSMTTESAGTRSTASRIWAVDGFIDWPPATTAWTPTLAQQPADPVADRDRDDRGGHRSSRPRSRVGQVRGLADPVLLLDLLEEVGDPDLGGTPGLDAGFDGGADVVGVHVGVPDPVAADHDDRVADRVPRLLEGGDGVVGGVEEVHDLVAQTRPRRRRASGRRPRRGWRPGSARGAVGRPRRSGTRRASSVKPRPPASTTPASLRTGSRSGVRSTAAFVAAPTPSSRVASAASPAPRAASAASAAARATVRIVPSTGRTTAW